MLGPSEGSRLTLIPHFRRPPVRNGQDRVNGNDIAFEPGATILEPPAHRASTSPRSAGTPSSPSSVTVGSAWCRSRAREAPRPAPPRRPKGWWWRRSPRPPWRIAGRCSASCWSATRASTCRTGVARPRNEFERYVTQYDVPIRDHDFARTGDERPGDVMIQHDMSTCILCTRCVRACEDIQEVGVLDVGMRGEHAQIIVGGDVTTRAAPGAASAFASARRARSSSSSPSSGSAPRRSARRTRWRARSARTAAWAARSICR